MEAFLLHIVKLSIVQKTTNFFFYFLFTYLTMCYDLKESFYYCIFLCIQHKFTLQMHIKGYQRSLPYKVTIHECTVTQLQQSIMYIHVHTFFYILQNKYYRINHYFCKLFSLSVESGHSSKPN